MGEDSEAEKVRERLLTRPRIFTPPQVSQKVQTATRGAEPPLDLDEFFAANERLTKYLRWKAQVKFLTPEKKTKKSEET